MNRYAVYYRMQSHGPMQMMPINADTPEQAGAKFRDEMQFYEYVQFWVTTEHLQGTIKEGEG